MASAVTLKKNYRCFQSLQQFYTGGPFAVSSDGSFLVCACDDTIKIVDSSNAGIKSTIDGDSEPVTALLLSPNDNFLFSVSHSRQIRVWDVSSLKCLRSWKGHEGPVMGMACHASGGLLATAGADKKVQVWDVDGGFCTHYFKGHKGVVTSIIFHPDPNRLLLFSGGDDATVRVWDLTKKKCVATLEKHQSTVTSMAISEDGWTLLTAGRDKVVNIWNLHDYSCATTVPTYEALEAVCAIDSASPFSLCLSSCTQKHGKKKISSSPIQFLTVGERGIVRIWNSDGAMLLFEQKSSDLTVSSEKEEVKRGFTSAMMLPLGQGLLCATADQQFLIYDLEKHADDGLNLVLKKRLIGYNEEIADMKFLGEEEQFLAVATSVEQVRVYDLASMSCSYVLTGHTDVVLCLDTCVPSSGRTLIVTGSKDNTVRLWESQSQRCIGIGIGHMGAVGAIAFSKKNRNFFVSGSSDRTLKVWSLDGISDDVGEVSNLKAKAVVAAHDKDINSIAIAPNDSLVCSGSQDRTACIWRLPDLVSVVVLKGHKRGIWSVEFSPVDQCVITASGDKTIKIWAISDGSCLKTFEGHTSSVIRASFITRGTQFISCGADGLMKLWTVKTNECLATYDQHEDKIWALAIGKQTEMIATGGGDAVINLWQDSTAAEKEEAFRKEEEGVLRGQELENSVLDADYTRAIQLAFELHRPHKLFELFSELCRKTDASVQIAKAISPLAKEELHLLLEYIREWNTKPKLCHIAHFVLYHVFSILPPTEILEMKGIGELLEGLIPYSQRHFSRIDRLERSTFLLDYTLTGMSVVEPERNETESRQDKLTEIAPEEHEESEEMIMSTKKRKLHKSQSRKQKKTKLAYTSVAAISAEV
ncbi:WD40-repeat-containing subunit of the 18S rRNA processing complex [Handroanthus impetiginosus]|uniref:WD40-repeat-containing subunit of the 18S rRNA processing complex n=1 Tax=Handroanthus impetiginosus TaxID=429701 RepID=A0A2G9I1N5_9LAMI|nr:WD40-repeat-containing subunit of the 18S rRNA processing complex [Handroanthus impetiginosus]